MSRMFVICCSLALLAGLAGSPQADAALVANDVSIVSGEGHAVASCQLLIVVGAVVIVGIEDGLSLATRRTEDASNFTISPGGPDAPVRASCDILLRTLRIVVPEGQAVRARSYVSGATAIDAVPFAENRYSVDAGAGSAVAICQHFLLVDSVVIGGGAMGMPAGRTPGPVLLTRSPADAHARCEVELGGVEIIETKREP